MVVSVCSIYTYLMYICYVFDIILILFCIANRFFGRSWLDASVLSSEDDALINTHKMLPILFIITGKLTFTWR